MNKVLRVARIEKGITQKQMALAVGVTSKYVSLIETKDLQPSPVIMEKISNCVGVSVQELFFRDAACKS